MEDKYPEEWLPSYRGKYVHFKTKLCLELVTKTEKRKYWFKIKVDPQVALIATDINDSDSSNVLKKTNPFTNPSGHEYVTRYV